MVGIRSSIAPARSIASRTIASTLRSTRRPSGDQGYWPAAGRRSMPALSISRWLAISASAGVSFSVCRWNCDRRMWAVVGEGLGILPCGDAAGGAGHDRLPAVGAVGAAMAAIAPPDGIAAMAAPTARTVDQIGRAHV